MDDRDPDEAATRQRLFESAVEKARARNIHIPPDEIENALEQALAEVRAERIGKSP